MYLGLTGGGWARAGDKLRLDDIVVDVSVDQPQASCIRASSHHITALPLTASLTYLHQSP